MIFFRFGSVLVFSRYRKVGTLHICVNTSSVVGIAVYH